MSCKYNNCKYCGYKSECEIYKENAELTKSCDETQELLDKQIEATYKLVEENEGLKARLNAINLLTPELEKQSKAKKKQLTKAKEIIKTFLGLAEAFGYSPSMDKFITEAEQFISEVEK